jgi:hypothetical protein
MRLDCILCCIASCWRGYVCEYKLLYNKFVLNRLQIDVDAQEEVRVNGTVLTALFCPFSTTLGTSALLQKKSPSR